MVNDSIVEEIRQVRARLLGDCGGDLDKLLDRYKLAEDQDRSRVVTLEQVRQRRRAAPGGRSVPR